MKFDIRTKRVYAPAEASDGARFLVDRLWPRGVKKEALQLTAWAKEATPSDALRKWIHADLSRWPEFESKYRAELASHPDAYAPLLAAAQAGVITLLFSAKDESRNNATVLKAFLEEQDAKHR